MMLNKFKIEVDPVNNPKSEFAFWNFVWAVQATSERKNIGILRPIIYNFIDTGDIKEFYLICDESHLTEFQDILSEYNAVAISALPSLENFTLHFRNDELLEKLLAE